MLAVLMRRRGIVWLLVAVAIAGGSLGVWLYRAHVEAEAVRAADALALARAERRDERQRRLREESERLIPPVISGVYLGMPIAEMRHARPQAAPDVSTRTATEEHTLVFEEHLANGARAVYVVDQRTDRLQRVQILSLMPPEGVGPHLGAMNAQYGAPTGIWDCPNTGGVPTRRFTWRHGETTVSDVFLVYGNRVSVTLYVAPSGVIERSLRMSACRPVRSREELESFPVATPEQVQASQGGP